MSSGDRSKTFGGHRPAAEDTDIDNIPINKNKPIWDAILMPKAAPITFSPVDLRKTMIDVSARHHHVSEFTATACLTRSLSNQRRNAAGYVRRNFILRSFIIKPDTG